MEAIEGNSERVDPYASTVERALREAERLNARYKLALHRLPVGILMLDRSAGLLESSQVARGFLGSRQTLCLKAGRVHGVIAKEDAWLQQAIQLAIGSGPGDGGRCAVLHGRKGTRSRLFVAVAPVTAPTYLLSAPPACSVLVLDAEFPAPAEILLREDVGLTAAEARLAGLLFSGLTLREAAERLNRSINTCKRQMQSIFAKTHCSSQVELAKAMLGAALARRLAR